MKKLNAIGSLCAAVTLTIGTGSNAQSFQKTLFDPGSDMNHYSIETTPNGEYILAGTLFRPGGNQDMHVMRLDANGNQIWSIEMDETDDDRALDLVVDPNGDIVVVGYIEDPISPTDGDMYIVKLDASGNFMGDLVVDGFHTAAATNIIYSNASNTYIVGGYMGEPFQVPMIGCVSRLLELDMGLSIINNLELSTSYNKHDNINDIVETPGGYFITGSMANTVSSPLGGQGVLAVFVDFGFNVTADLSFESTNHEHVGVSAIYDPAVDEVWLMSNNSIVHNPQITQIVDVSGSPFINTEYYLYVDPNYGVPNAAGFKLEMSPYDPTSLVACGLFRTNNDYLGNSNSATPWIVEFERGSGTTIGAYMWPAPSPNFHTHGGGMFSTFSGEHPYFFNQELMIPRPDGNGFTIVGPVEEAGNYGIDVITTINLRNPDVPCFEPIDCDPYTISHTANPVVDDPQSVVDTSPGYGWPGNGIAEAVWCEAIYDFRIAEENGGAESSNPSSFDMGGITVAISPNPVASSAFIEISGGDLTGHQFVLRNAIGQEMYSSTQLEGNYFSDRIDLSNLPSGIYFLTLSGQDEGVMQVTKLVKQ